MQRLNGKSQTNVVGYYKSDRFTLFNSANCDVTIFINKISARRAGRIYKKKSLQLSPYNSLVHLNQNSIQELVWRVNNLEISNGKSFLLPINKIIIQTDTSRKDWNAYCQKISIEGQWTLQKLRLQISLLELKFINLVLLTFHNMFCLKASRFQVDITTVLLHLMKMWGTGSKEMTPLAKEIWKSL